MVTATMMMTIMTMVSMMNYEDGIYKQKQRTRGQQQLQHFEKDTKYFFPVFQKGCGRQTCWELLQ